MVTSAFFDAEPSELDAADLEFLHADRAERPAAWDLERFTNRPVSEWWHSYCDFINYVSRHEPEEQQHDERAQSPPKSTAKKAAFIGEFDLEPATLLADLEGVVSVVEDLVRDIKALTKRGSHRRKILEKCGLLSFANQHRKRLVNMKNNCIRKTTQKAFKAANLYPGQRIQLQVRINMKLVAVELKYEYAPGNDADRTLREYWTKVLACRDDVNQLGHIVDLASKQYK